MTDIVRWYNFTTFDIVGDLCFGKSFGALSTQEYHSWVNNIFKGLKFVKYLRVGRRYPLFGYMLEIVLRLFPSVNKARNDHAQFTVQKTEKRLDTSMDRKDFMTYVRILPLQGSRELRTLDPPSSGREGYDSCRDHAHLFIFDHWRLRDYRNPAFGNDILFAYEPL